MVDQRRTRHKSCALSDEEVFLLMRAFTRDKSCITEDDAMTLCRWAQAQKFGAFVLKMVLQGHLRVRVENGRVRVGVQPGAAPCKGTYGGSGGTHA